MSQIPAAAWSRSLGQGWSSPYTVRYASNLDDGPWHGMPLGGFGAGCIGRSPRGECNLWHLDGGEHVFRTMPACQFSVFEQVEDTPAQAWALCTEPPADGSLSAWQWYPASPPEGAPTGTYHALYPRSWFVYDRVFQAQLTCEQFSPIWADNYQETSYPVALFNWTVTNPGDRPLTLSLMFTWQNLVGWFTNANPAATVRLRDDGSPVYDYEPRLDQSAGNFNQWVPSKAAVGLLMDRLGRPDRPREGDGQFAIAVPRDLPGVEVFYHTRWQPTGDGAEIWASFAADGSLPNVHDQTPAGENEQIAGAIALRFTLAPGATQQIPLSLTWDFPVTEFAAGIESYRRYTDFFGRGGRTAWAIAREALKQAPTWHQHIVQWQESVLATGLPDWFYMALFNELYDLTSGGTLWSAASDRDPVGQFAVLECLDYRWYESLDVRLYGSFALLYLWPELDKAVLNAFARAIPTADDRPRVIGYYATLGLPNHLAPRKVADATPHDLGAPNEHPWERTNYTAYQDCNLWKDLGSDFVLQVYRDFVLTGATDRDFLAACWPAITATLAYLKTFDHDQDGIPENSGAPDQTFDDWRLQGISAYCGGLWIAALEAAIAIAAHLPATPDLTTTLQTYQTWLTQARSQYHDQLWNGQYYRLDTGSGSDVVMADQLCGQFYARLLGLPDVVPENCGRSALKTVYEACFRQFHNGQFGLANGLRPDGTPQNPNDTHPLEVWTGINFSIAAFMVQMGLRQEALTVTEAVVRQIYDHGLQFRTPEAITAVGTFRACHYLRPMAIWGLYAVLTGAWPDRPAG